MRVLHTVAISIWALLCFIPAGASFAITYGHSSNATRPTAENISNADVQSLLATLSACGVDRPFISIPNLNDNFNNQVAPPLAFNPTPLIPPGLTPPAFPSAPPTPKPAPPKNTEVAHGKESGNNASESTEPGSSSESSSAKPSTDEEAAKPASHDLDGRMREDIFKKNGCVGCHGPDGDNRPLFDKAGNPLGEKEAKNIAAALNGKIASPKMQEIMKRVKSGFSEEDKALVEEWTKAHAAAADAEKPKRRPVAEAAAQTAADKAVAGHFKSSCLDCHGTDGFGGEFFTDDGFVKSDAIAKKILALYQGKRAVPDDMEDTIETVRDELAKDPAMRESLKAWAEQHGISGFELRFKLPEE